MSKARVAFLLVAALVVATVLVGCASGGADPAELEGSWKLESFGGTTELVPADPNVTSTLDMKAGEASGSGGVNTFSGGYEASEGAVTFGPLATTMMAGEPAAMDQEAKFLAALDKTEHFEINEGKLVLADKGNNTLLVFVAK